MRSRAARSSSGLVDAAGGGGSSVATAGTTMRLRQLQNTAICLQRWLRVRLSALLGLPIKTFRRCIHCSTSLSIKVGTNAVSHSALPVMQPTQYSRHSIQPPYSNIRISDFQDHACHEAKSDVKCFSRPFTVSPSRSNPQGRVHTKDGTVRAIPVEAAKAAGLSTNAAICGAKYV